MYIFITSYVASLLKTQLICYQKLVCEDTMCINIWVFWQLKISVD